ncbi:unnamed protein product [Phytophthora fragariaefolia]|uniref:Unnamed protein product n=1 Tax=Phytophthora fragariaefolia TaxID=1490495 RepID=A0A9W7D4X0_9STRA|nr:unnamed protein product [Phytophthora fragariaefolia]
MDQVLASLPATHTSPSGIQDVARTRHLPPPKMVSSLHCFIVGVMTSALVSRVLDVIFVLAFFIVSSSVRPSISPQVWTTLPQSPIHIQSPHFTNSTIWYFKKFTSRKLISWVIFSDLHGTETSPGFRTLVELIEERTTPQLCHWKSFSFIVTFPFDEVITAALRRASTFRPSQVQDLLHLILVVQVVDLPTVFREQRWIEVIVSVHVNLISRSFRKYSPRFETTDVYPRIDSVTDVRDLAFHPEVVKHPLDPERTMGQLHHQTIQHIHRWIHLHYHELQLQLHLPFTPS